LLVAAWLPLVINLVLAWMVRVVLLRVVSGVELAVVLVALEICNHRCTLAAPVVLVVFLLLPRLLWPRLLVLPALLVLLWIAAQPLLTCLQHH